MGAGPNPYVNGAMPLVTKTYSSFGITRVSNWGYWYEIDGKRLSKMDLSNATIIFPNPELKNDDVHFSGRLLIVDHGLHYSDHGHPGVGPNEEIWMVVNLHGYEFRRQWLPDTKLDEAFHFSWTVPVGL